MLIRLNSEQVMRYWPSVEEALRAAVPFADTFTSEQMLDLQEKCVRGALQTWLVYNVQADATGQDKVLPLAIGLTTVLEAIGHRGKELLIYALCSYENVPMDIWREAFESLKKFARSEGCSVVTALTKSPRVLQMVRQIGGNVETTYCRMEV